MQNYKVSQKYLEAIKISPRFMRSEKFQDVLMCPSTLDSSAKVIGLRHFENESVIYLNVGDVKIPLINYFEELVKRIEGILNT
jgi:hypothetical protein